MTIPEAIKALRKHRRMSQQAFATALQLSIRCVVFYERGYRKPIPRVLSQLHHMAMRFELAEPTVAFWQEMQRTQNPYAAIFMLKSVISSLALMIDHTPTIKEAAKIIGWQGNGDCHEFMANFPTMEELSGEDFNPPNLTDAVK